MSGPSIADLITLMRDTSAVSTGDKATRSSAVEGQPAVEMSAVEKPLVEVTERPIPRGGLSTTDDVLRFAAAYGCEGRLTRSAFVTWKLRLDVESGQVRPCNVGADPLPDDVRPIVRTSYEGFVHLLGCRWLHTPDEPAPWTHPFAARWTGITMRQAKDARWDLVQIGALVHVGNSGRAKLWLPWGVDA
jgi:hypothetical protein